jgi:hypothetical protein
LKEQIIDVPWAHKGIIFKNFKFKQGSIPSTKIFIYEKFSEKKLEIFCQRGQKNYLADVLVSLAY